MTTIPRDAIRLGWLVCIVSLILLTMAAQGAAPICRPSDFLVTRTVAHLQQLVTSTDPTDKAVRDSLRITATRASDISYVTDERTCGKALPAYNTAMSTPSAVRQLYVYKIGRDFAVEDPTVGQDSHYRGLHIFDSKWLYKRTYLAQ
jgi:hypothetical protein